MLLLGGPLKMAPPVMWMPTEGIITMTKGRE